MRTPLLLCAAAFGLAPAVSAQSILLSESFEGDDSGYSAPGVFFSNDDDHFRVTDGSDIDNSTGPYTNIDGTFLFAMEDIDAPGSDGESVKTITFDAVSATGFSDLTLSVRVGAGNEGGPGAGAYDRSDFAAFRYSFDGGQSFQNCLAFQYIDNGDAANEPLAQDTDFDGIGDGIVLGNALQTFTCAISADGATDLSSLVVQGEFSFNAGSEEFGFDLVEVRGISSEVPNADPSASFTFDAMGLTVDFTDTSSDSDGSVDSWAWSFGDGGSSMMQNPSYTYATGGTYTVTLTVTDDDGATDTASQSVMVMGDPGPGPGADVTGSLARGTCSAAVPSSTSRCFLQATGTNNTDEAQRFTVFVRLEGPGGFARIAKRGEIKLAAGGTGSNKLSLRTKRSDPDGAYDAVLLAEMGSVSSPSAAAVELDRISFTKGGAGLRAEQALAAYPNPAADVATLSFSVAEAGEATLTVYDALGREVARLVDGAVEGLVEASVDASALPAGLYVARLVVEGRVETTRFSVVR